MSTNNQVLAEFYEQQISEWPQLLEGVDALLHVRTKQLTINGDSVQVQFNPLRAINVRAKVGEVKDTGSCFLCQSQRPAEQRSIPFGDDFLILCNPRPIFDRHFTVVAREHRPQTLVDSLALFFKLAETYTEYAVFYNGSKSGASAPFHLHFQLVPKKFLPVCASPPSRHQYAGAPFHTMLSPEYYGSEMLNIVAWVDEVGLMRSVTFSRVAHRPKSFFDDSFVVSPACVELSGVWVTVREQDYQAASEQILAGVLSEVVGR